MVFREKVRESNRFYPINSVYEYCKFFPNEENDEIVYNVENWILSITFNGWKNSIDVTRGCYRKNSNKIKMTWKSRVSQSKGTSRYEYSYNTHSEATDDFRAV